MRRKKGKHCFTKKREREAQTRRQRAAKIRGKREGQTGRVRYNQTLIVLGAGKEGRAKTSAALSVRGPEVRRKKGKHRHQRDMTRQDTNETRQDKKRQDKT